MMMRLLAVAVMGTTVLTGCATLSKQECMTGNWQAIGFADGAAGRSSDYLSQHNKACAKAGVAPDYQIWERGRQEGLKQYCTAQNAYQLGRRGAQINAVCPADIAADLEQINADGRQYYALDKQLDIETKRLDNYLEEYRQLREGGNLNFSNERDARTYLLQLPKKIEAVEARISNIKTEKMTLQQQYGY